jgi:glucans biosynthesis protein C
MTSTHRTATPSRRFDLDWLRIAAFGLLILYHVGMAFVPWGWHIKLAQIGWLEPVMLFTNAWRLLLLFLISGIATATMTAKSQDGLFISRCRRLLLPLLFGVVLIVPPQPWVEVQVSGQWSGSYLSFWRTEYFAFSDHLGLILPTWNHLWFIVYLWAYTALLAAGLQLPVRVRAGLQQGMESALAGSRLLWVPIIFIGGVRLLLADSYPETHNLARDWAAHVVYAGAFFIGVAMGPAGPLWAQVDRLRRSSLLLGLVGWAVVAAINQQPGDPAGIVLTASRVARAVQAWGMIIGLLGIARRWLSFDHDWRQPLAEAVFPAYLVHQTIIVLTAWWLLPMSMPIAAKAMALLIVTTGGTFVFCRATARVAWLRPWVGYGPRK